MANRPDNEVELHRLELRFAATRVSDARAVQRLVQSIDACGQLIECIAVGELRPLPEGDDKAAAVPLVLIDGYRRVAALRKLGRDTALVECWRCTVAQALAQLLARSRSRAFTAVEEALLLRDLVDGQGLSQREAARQCGRDVSWVQRRLQLLGVVPESVLRSVCREQISTWSAVRVFVPLARANAEHAQQLLSSLSQPQQTLSTRELNTWFAQYRCAQRGQRERMVEHPRLFIDSLNERERERAAKQLKGGPEQQAVAELAHLHAQLERVRRSLGALQVPVAVPLSRACRRVRGALPEVDAELRRLGHEVAGDHRHCADVERPGPLAARDQPAAAPVA
ncbi:MAG: ParB/RepB/Spo0J family partition protein [Rubrivivax sp.]|nr:ParB/RepB/Spo0J family partition protein [Rubrivivax sp.]